VEDRVTKCLTEMVITSMVVNAWTLLYSDRRISEVTEVSSPHKEA
jgi:hypothetical protein